MSERLVERLAARFAEEGVTEAKCGDYASACDQCRYEYDQAARSAILAVADELEAVMPENHCDAADWLRKHAEP